MLQLGRYSYRGKGAVLVTGPCGAALVPLAWTGSAEEAMTGRVQVGVWARDIASARADAFILDLAGPQVIVSLIGSARIKAGRLGHAEPEEWSPPVWGKPIDPGEWEYLDVTLGDTQDGAWRLLDDDAVLAGQVRVGRPLHEMVQAWGADHTPAPLDVLAAPPGASRPRPTHRGRGRPCRP